MAGDYKIRISTTADGQGAQQTAEGLKQVTTEATKAGAAAKTVETATKGVENAAKSAAPAIQQTSRAVGEQTTRLTEWKKAASLVGQQIPGLGGAFQLLNGPIVAISAAIAGIIHLINKFVQEMEQAEESALNVAAGIDAANTAMGQMTGVTKEATEAAEEYQRALAALADEADAVDASLSSTVKDIDRSTRIAGRKDQASVRAQEAEIDAQVAQGKMTPAAAAAAKRGLRAGLDARNAQREEDALVAKQAATGRAAAEKADIALRAEEALPAAEAAARDARLRARRYEVGAGAMTGAIDERRKALQSKINDLEKRAAGPSFMDVLMLKKDLLTPEMIHAQLTDARGELAGLDEQRFRIGEQVSGRNAGATAAERTVARLRSTSLSARRSATATDSQAQDLGADLTAMRQERAAAAPYARREASAQEAIAAANAAREANEATTKAMIELLRKWGFNADQLRKQIEAEKGR